MRVFQKLEYGTERLWVDFSRQYSTRGGDLVEGNREAIQGLKDKYLPEDQAQGADEGEAEGEKKEPPKSLWQRAWTAVMENLELGQPAEASSDDESVALSDEENEDGDAKLNKRQRKLLQKSKSYSDVI